MNKEIKKTEDNPSSNFEEILPKGKVDEGNKAVVKDKDLPDIADTSDVRTNNPAKEREEGEQPVHPIKKEPKD